MHRKLNYTSCAVLRVREDGILPQPKRLGVDLKRNGPTWIVLASECGGRLFVRTNGRLSAEALNVDQQAKNVIRLRTIPRGVQANS